MSVSLAKTNVQLPSFSLSENMIYNHAITETNHLKQ